MKQSKKTNHNKHNNRKSNKLEYKYIITNIDTPEKLTKEELTSFLEHMEKLFSKEPQLIKLPNKETIFVGDTHGDYSATKKVIKKYLKKDNIVVFLGDYVDRATEENGDIKNILYLFYLKMEHKNLILLRGNHEGLPSKRYGFSENLEKVWGKNVWNLFFNVFSQIPLVAEGKSFLGLHGGLPKIKNLDQINKIPKGLSVSQNKFLDQIMWNDSLDKDKKIIEKAHRGAKNAFSYGKKYFDEIMKKLDKQTLFRGHDYKVKGSIYEGRCVTIFTSIRYANRPKDIDECEEPIFGRFVAKVPKSSKGEYKIEKI